VSELTRFSSMWGGWAVGCPEFPGAGALSLFLCEDGSGPGRWMRLGVGQRHLEPG
jgi:hypothetical protein